MCELIGGLMLCSGTLGYTPSLELVAERRYIAEWGGLADDPAGYAVLVGLEDCALLGKTGWLFSRDNIYRALVADCSQRAHPWPAGYLGDVSLARLGTGWLVLE